MVPPLIFPPFSPPRVSDTLRVRLLTLLLLRAWLLTLESSDISSDSSGGSVQTDVFAGILKLVAGAVVREVTFAGASLAGASTLLLETTDWLVVEGM